jgi:hypothetical protein
MGVVGFISRYLGTGIIGGEDLRDLKTAPEDRLPETVGYVFYDLALRYASGFVRDEIARSESPFLEVPQEKLFHEVMILNIWIVQRTINKNKMKILDHIRTLYASCSMCAGKKDVVLQEIDSRCETYNQSWNDFTGFQDEFGKRAAENIFGKDVEIPYEQVTFWIIFYADRIMQKFKKAKRECAAYGVRI